MKLFRLIGTMTIVAAVAATMAVSASAFTATYADNKVALEDVADANKGDYTVVITTAEANNDTKEGDIFQLVQSTDKPAEVLVDEDLAPGKYYVRVGGYETGIEVAEFVKTLEVNAAATVVASEEGTPASWYKVVTKAPAGLTPYWTAEGAEEDLPALFGNKMANAEGNVMLGLAVKGETAPATVTLIWK